MLHCLLYFYSQIRTAQQLADRLGDQQAVECSETKWSFFKAPFLFLTDKCHRNLKNYI